MWGFCKTYWSNKINNGIAWINWNRIIYWIIYTIFTGWLAWHLWVTCTVSVGICPVNRRSQREDTYVIISHVMTSEFTFLAYWEHFNSEMLVIPETFESLELVITTEQPNVWLKIFRFVARFRSIQVFCLSIFWLKKQLKRKITFFDYVYCFTPQIR